MKYLIVIISAFFLKLSAQTQIDSIESKHLKNIKQLTFGGDNAEAYFSPNGKFLAFQSNNPKWGLQCDQIFSLDIAKAIKKQHNYMPKKISNGLGRTTCSYYMPNSKDILYASTFKGSHTCPTPVTMQGKYLWNIFSDFDIFIANQKGKIIKQLTNDSAYDAEATVSPKGDKIVFTSTRSGDLELWIMNIDGSGLKQLTFDLGYDGGAFFSPDGSQLVFRSSRPKTEEEIKEYKDLLSQGLVAPTNMEIYVIDTNGQNLKQITSLGKANWAPFYHPSGKKILFSSNHASKRGYDFQLYMINTDGTQLVQITNQSIFNAFPMFSPDGKKLVFSSNRNNGDTKDTNLFIADWID